MTGIRIVRPSEGRPWWWLGGIVRLPATGEDTGGRYMMEEAEVRPGGGPAAHIQTREDECFYLLEGGPLEFTAGNRKLALGAGAFINIRQGTAHTFKNVGDAPAKLLLWNVPAGFDRFQFAAGEEPSDIEEPRKASDEDRRRIAEVAPDFGIEMDPGSGAFEREPEIHVVEPVTIEGTTVAGQVWSVLGSPDDTDERFSMYRVAVPPGEPGPQHFQADIGLYVTQGTLGIDLNGEIFEAPSGTLVEVPSGPPVRMWGTGEQRAILLLWAAPARDLLREIEAP